MQVESSQSVIVIGSTDDNLRSGSYVFLGLGSDHFSDRQDKNYWGANVTLPSI